MVDGRLVMLEVDGLMMLEVGDLEVASMLVLRMN